MGLADRMVRLLWAAGGEDVAERAAPGRATVLAIVRALPAGSPS